MSNSINCLVSGTTLTQQILDSAVENLISGYGNTAIQELAQCGLNEKQIAKVIKIINKSLSGDCPVTKPKDLIERILVKLTKQPTSDVVVPQKTGPSVCVFPACSVNASETLENTYFGYMDAFPNDVVLEIFMQCILGGHNKSVKAFAMTSHKWHATTEKIIGELDLKQLCPRLTIWDAKTLGFEVDDEPQIDRFGLIEAYQALASHPVKGNQGILCFPMSKGLSIQGLLSEASKLGLQVVVHPSSPLEGLYSYASPIERTYSLMILESFFEGDFNWQYKEQREFAIKINCNLPSLEESLALHIFKYKVTKQPLLCTHIWGCTETLSKNATGVPLGTEILISFDNQSTYLRITKYVHARMPFNNFTGVCRFLG